MAKSSRETVLQRLRRSLPQSAPLPDLSDAARWQTFDDCVERFAEVLESVGGRCEPCETPAGVEQSLQQRDEWRTADVRISTVDGVGRSGCRPDDLPDPHDLENVDFAVLPGELAVAENGAVWVTDAAMKHRALLFIAQHVALVVPARNVVHNMHQAYQRIAVGQSPFGVFVSGPSKTADIEQSLVIGAHGARSLTVFLVADGN